MFTKITRKLHLVKDKNYAWCILALSFLSHTSHQGFVFSLLGNTAVAHAELFSLSTQQTSVIGSIHSGIFFLAAPLVSVIVKKIGCRLTEIIGGALLILGLGLSAFSSELWHAYVLYGIIAAFGASCCLIASAEILPLHFSKYKYLAFAVGASGLYTGRAFWPILSQKLFNEYSYHKAMAIMASIHSIHIMAGLLFFEPERNDSIVKDNPNSGKEREHNSENTQCVEPLITHEGKNAERSEVLKEAQSDDSKSITELQEEQPHRDKLENGDSVNELPKPHPSLLESFKMLLTSPKVWIFIFNNFVWIFNTTGFLILVNAYVEQRLSISSETTALGLTILGISNLAGSGMVMAVSRFKFDRFVLHCVCSSVYGVCTIIVAFSTNKETFYACASIWGLALGIQTSNLLAVIYEICGAEQLTLLYGLRNFAAGLGSICAAPICGYVGSRYGSEYSLILCGSGGILASIVILPVIIYNHRRACVSSTEKGNETNKSAAVKDTDDLAEP